MTTSLSRTEVQNETEDVVRKYATIIVKNIMSTIESNEKKREKATERKLKESETAGGVRSMRHWKATAGISFYYEENQKLLNELVHINRLTNFTENLHQDRYKFVEKYPFALSELLDRV